MSNLRYYWSSWASVLRLIGLVDPIKNKNKKLDLLILDGQKGKDSTAKKIAEAIRFRQALPHPMVTRSRSTLLPRHVMSFSRSRRNIVKWSPSPRRITDNQKPPPTTSDQTKAHPTTSGQRRNQNEQCEQPDNMSPKEAHEYQKSSTYLFHDNETKGLTKSHDDCSPKASNPKKDALEVSTPDKTSEKQRACSNSPPSSQKRRYESITEIEVNEETPKKKRISVAH